MGRVLASAVGGGGVVTVGRGGGGAAVVVVVVLVVVVGRGVVVRRRTVLVPTRGRRLGLPRTRILLRMICGGAGAAVGGEVGRRGTGRVARVGLLGAGRVVGVGRRGAGRVVGEGRRGAGLVGGAGRRGVGRVGGVPRSSGSSAGVVPLDGSLCRRAPLSMDRLLASSPLLNLRSSLSSSSSSSCSSSRFSSPVSASTSAISDITGRGRWVVVGGRVGTGARPRPPRFLTYRIGFSSPPGRRGLNRRLPRPRVRGRRVGFGVGAASISLVISAGSGVLRGAAVGRGAGRATTGRRVGRDTAGCRLGLTLELAAAVATLGLTDGATGAAELPPDAGVALGLTREPPRRREEPRLLPTVAPPEAEVAPLTGGRRRRKLALPPPEGRGRAVVGPLAPERRVDGLRVGTVALNRPPGVTVVTSTRPESISLKSASPLMPVVTSLTLLTSLIVFTLPEVALISRKLFRPCPRGRVFCPASVASGTTLAPKKLPATGLTVRRDSAGACVGWTVGLAVGPRINGDADETETARAGAGVVGCRVRALNGRGVVTAGTPPPLPRARASPEVTSWTLTSLLTSASCGTAVGSVVGLTRGPDAGAAEGAGRFVTPVPNENEPPLPNAKFVCGTLVKPNGKLPVVVNTGTGVLKETPTAPEAAAAAVGRTGRGDVNTVAGRGEVARNSPSVIRGASCRRGGEVGLGTGGARGEENAPVGASGGSGVGSSGPRDGTSLTAAVLAVANVLWSRNPAFSTSTADRGVVAAVVRSNRLGARDAGRRVTGARVTGEAVTA